MKLPEDPVILELLPEFIDTWIADIESQYSNLIQTKNSDDLYRLGHTIKGSCFQFGLDETAQIGIQIMAHARAGEWAEASGLGDILLKNFLEVKAFLESKGLV